MAKISSYVYSFHYQSGQRATQDMVSGNTHPNDLLQYVYGLARDKKKTIYIRSRTPRWYNENVTECGWVKPSGEYYISPVNYYPTQGKL